MKTQYQCRKFLIPVAMGWLLTATTTISQPVDYARLADNIVNKTVMLKPGEHVIIYGNKNLMECMEQLAIAVDNAGGHSTMAVSSDQVSYNYLHNVPIEYVRNDKKLFFNYILSSDVLISLPSCSDCMYVRSNISEERRKLTVFTEEDLQKLNQSKVRQYYFQSPQKEWAANYGFTESEFESMTWKAMETDYANVAQRCKKINDLLVSGKQIRITSPDGTDFTANLTGKPAMLNDGIVTSEELNSKVYSDRFVSLPTGSLTFIPDENAGNGTIVSRNDADTDGKSLEKVKGIIKSGMITEMSAEKGNEFIKGYFSSASPKDRQLGMIFLGVNPELKIGNNPLYYINETEGFVGIGFGGNLTEGGTNNATNGWYFPVVDATVTIDGKNVIEKGKVVIQ